MSRLGGAGAVAPLVTDLPLSSSVEVREKNKLLKSQYQKFSKWILT